MEFKKYQHVERLGAPVVRDIQNGLCYIFPKIDGTNGSVWPCDVGIGGGSRRRELDESKDGDNAGFYKWIQANIQLKLFFEKHPNLRLYGEWLVPHTIKEYVDDAWKRFYVFDVMDENDNYLSYDEYAPLLDEYELDYLKPLAVINTPSLLQLESIMNSNTVMMVDECLGEGIVIKRYDFVNQFGHIVWAKMIRAEFKAEHGKWFGKSKPKSLVEESIIEEYVTRALVEKEFAKILNDVGGEWKMKYTNKLLNTVFYCLITEESWNFVKKFNNPTIDFNRLMYLCSNKAKSFIQNIILKNKAYE